jgi:hypothetical protein
VVAAPFSLLHLARERVQLLPPPHHRLAPDEDVQLGEALVQRGRARHDRPQPQPLVKCCL